MAVFAEAWVQLSDSSDQNRSPLKTDTPSLPVGYREVFRDCIKYAEPAVSNSLARILTQLQIHNSRMRDLIKSFQQNSSEIVVPQNIIGYLHGIGEIQALVNANFSYARGREDFDDSPLERQDYYSALVVGGIEIDDYDGLQETIERAIAGD
jgi:hypothetical protein